MSGSKVLFGAVLGLLAGGVWLALAGQHVAAAAFPCNAPAEFGVAPCHGYFYGGNGTTTNVNLLDNVLPPPALNKVTNAANFASIIKGDLYSGDFQTRIGAAFIIDTMLDQTGWGGRGGGNAGLAYARSNFATWVQLVNHYASAPGGASYGVNWKWTPSYDEFCGLNGYPPTVNSAYFTNIGDDAFHTTICPYGFTFGTPVIVFHWAGGSFDIGRGCGNVELSLKKIPTDNPPTGSISVTCNATQQQVATVTLSDPDAPTTGFVTVLGNGWPGAAVSSPGPAQVTIPQSATDPYAARTVQLRVKDTGPVGTGAYSVFTAQTSVPCVALSCGNLAVTPSQVDPYMSFAVIVSVTNNVGAAPPGATITLTITPPAGAAYRFTGTQSAVGAAGVSSATFSGLGPTNSAGVFGASWTLLAGAASKTCQGSFTVAYLPYLSVYGGDVAVGASPTYSGTASSCATNPNAGIFSWNNHSTDFSGAGAQYAVEALAQIEDFASAQGSSNTPPTGLSFANDYTPPDGTKLNPAQGLFGGYFGASDEDCDFTSDLTVTPQTVDTTIGATTVAAGTQDIRFIKDADVFISGDIAYASTNGWTSVSAIPYFKLVVVGGNIYIGSSVTQLDGLYIAEPDSTGGGVIYTCATGLRAPADPTSAGYYSACNTKLVVNGAFVAEQVQFMRTTGSLGQATSTDSVDSNHAAEVFNYTPELWLPRNSGPPSDRYDAITALPPVL
ncbi:MAG TPA: hypothetical protein VH599_07310 [Ktedonobacterales bacterium]|jgi:hypothetical protein